MFLFTDLDKINDQTADQAFGPTPVDGNLNFQVTNKFRLKPGAKAYMPMQGDVAIIPQDDDPQNAYTNAIIRVLFDQNSKYTQIAYILYRGILKSSLLNTNQSLKARGTNDLLTRVWEMWDEDRKRPDSKASASGPTNDTIGWASRNIALPTDRLDTLFGSGKYAVGLPMLAAGQVIGTFASDIDISVDIILAEPLMLPTLELAFGTDNLVSISPTVAAATVPTQKPAEKLARAKVMAYLDISTLYSISADQEGITYQDFGPPPPIRIQNKDDIYNTILVKFYGRNTVYLDLRNEVSLPLNHFNEYRQFDETSLFYYSLDDSTLSSFREDWPWPLYLIRNPNTSTHKVRLAFKTIRNPDPLVFREYGTLTLSKSLKKGLGNQADFISLYNGTYSNFSIDKSKEIEFALTQIDLGNGDFAVMGGAIKLMVLRRTVGIVEVKDSAGNVVETHFSNAGNGPVRKQYLDNVFGPIESLVDKPVHRLFAKRWVCQGDLSSKKVAGAIVQIYCDYDADHVIFTASVLASYASLAFDDDTQAGLQLSELGKVMNRRRAENQYNLADSGAAWEKTVLGNDMHLVQVNIGPLTSSTKLNYWGGPPREKESLSLSFARQEYESLLAQITSFDLSLGGVYCFFRPFTCEDVAPVNVQSVSASVVSTTLTLGGYVGSYVSNYYEILSSNDLAFQERFFSLDYQTFATAASSGMSEVVYLRWTV